MIRAVLLIASLPWLGACDLREAFSANVETVARAGRHELTVSQVAELMARSSELPIRRDVIEGVAMLWVDYTLFADRMVLGDSLLDSASVVAARWPDVQQAMADRYHQQLVGQVADLDSARVDSIYRAGEWRLIKHILFSVPAEAPDEVRQAKRRQATDLLNRLRAGRVTWAAAAEQSEEPNAAEREGSLGVIARGEMVTPFENAAYALAPGALSDIVETAFGYHIVSRPALADAREEFTAGARSRLEFAFDEEYLEQIPERWNLEVRGGAPDAVRELVQDLNRAMESRTVLGTWRGGGRFRGRDFAQWVRGMDPQLRGRVMGATDEQLSDLVRSLMRNELLLLEAQEAGVALSPDDMGVLREQVARQLALLRAVMGLLPDTLAAIAPAPEADRRTAGQLYVMSYLRAIGNNERRFQQVPPFLGDRLREATSWELVPAGIERALARARELRAALDSVTTPTPQAPPAGGADSATTGF